MPMSVLLRQWSSQQYTLGRWNVLQNKERDPEHVSEPKVCPEYTNPTRRNNTSVHTMDDGYSTDSDSVSADSVSSDRFSSDSASSDIGSNHMNCVLCHGPVCVTSSTLSSDGRNSEGCSKYGTPCVVRSARRSQHKSSYRSVVDTANYVRIVRRSSSRINLISREVKEKEFRYRIFTRVTNHEYQEDDKNQKEEESSKKPRNEQNEKSLVGFDSFLKNKQESIEVSTTFHVRKIFNAKVKRLITTTIEGLNPHTVDVEPVLVLECPAFADVATSCHLGVEDKQTTTTPNANGTLMFIVSLIHFLLMF